MQKVLASVVMLLLVGASGDEADVRRNFDRYRQALEQREGPTAFSLIDAASRNYYAQLLEKTQFATPAQCASYSTIEKLSILLGRLGIPAEQLGSFDTEDYFLYAVEQGWVSPIGGEAVTVERVVVDGDEAHLYIRRGEDVSPVPHVFRRENGEWKLSLIEMLPLAEDSMAQYVKRADKPQQEALFDLVESALGTRPTEETWEPLLQRPR